MSDTEDDYLDEYVQSVLSHAINGLNMEQPREYNGEGCDARISTSSCHVPASDAGVNNLHVNSQEINLGLDLDGMKRSFSSPAIPDLGSRLCHRAESCLGKIIVIFGSGGGGLILGQF